MEAKEKETLQSQVEDTSVGTAADVDEIMKKYDRESNTRIWEGRPRLIVYWLGILFSCYCIFSTLKGWPTLPEQKLNIFIGLILIMGYLHFPVKKGITKVNYIPWYDWIIMIVGTFPFFYFAYRANDVLMMAIATTDDLKMVVFAIIGILALMELCRRSVGIPILCVLGVLLVYTFMNVRFGKMIYDLFYTTSGVMGTPINVCQKYIVVFIIFGAFLERTGISNFFINLANCVAGASAGGPAKVAVISSALCGMVSGSSVGNTVTTGSVTIPMMKRTGYEGEFAGAVEAAASTGGQIMPPIMGAAAFLMAEYMGIPYAEVALKAILPAVLYFTGIYIAVHLEAKKLGFARGDIYAQVKESMERQGVSVFSSNYALYQNLSDRVMSVLSSLCPAIDQYSIDEAFFTPSGLMSAAELRRNVTKATGIPVSVSVARTKTLAKAAGKIAKNNHDFAYELMPDRETTLLDKLPVADVWGDGRRYAIKLPILGIRTARQLRDVNFDWFSKKFPITLQRVVLELRGIEAHVESDNTVSRQSGMTFSHPLMDYQSIKNALDIQARYLSEKLTEEGLLAGVFGVSIFTNRFEDDFEAPCMSVRFNRETAYMPTFSRAVSFALPHIFNPARM